MTSHRRLFEASRRRLTAGRRLVGRRRRLLATLTAAFVALVAVGSLNYGFPDFLDHTTAAARIADGELLYRDHVEHINVYHYPPVYLYSLGAVYAVVGADPLAAKALLALSTVVTGWLAFSLAERWRGRRTAWVCLGAFLLNPLTAVGAYGGYFDPFVTCFLLASVVLLTEERSSLAGITLALGAMSKPFPVAVLALFVGHCLRTDGLSTRRFLLGVGGVVLAVSAPFLAAAPAAYLKYAAGYNFARQAASMSLYYYAVPAVADSWLVSLLPALVVAGATVMLLRAPLSPLDRLVDGSALILFGFVATNRINYPHYLLYLTPLLAVMIARHHRAGTSLRGVAVWQWLVGWFGVVVAGASLWAHPWLVGTSGFRASPLFALGAAVYYLGAAGLLWTMVAGLRAATSDEWAGGSSDETGLLRRFAP